LLYSLSSFSLLTCLCQLFTSLLQDAHTCWHGFDAAAMWEDLNQLAATPTPPPHTTTTTTTMLTLN
jgi:hypothetical protein